MDNAITQLAYFLFGVVVGAACKSIGIGWVPTGNKIVEPIKRTGLPDVMLASKIHSKSGND